MHEVGIESSIIKEFNNAYLSSVNDSGYALGLFKEKYPKEYKTITAMYRKRSAIRDTLELMQYVSKDIYWFTLTFNNERDDSLVKTKCRQAQRFLNEICTCYVMVEELGSEKERYHIHGFLTFSEDYGFDDFRKWHSRQNLKKLDYYGGKVKYLTKYTTKSVPRIRRSKLLSILYTYHSKHKGLKRHFRKMYEREINERIFKYFI